MSLFSLAVLKYLTVKICNFLYEGGNVIITKILVQCVCFQRVLCSVKVKKALGFTSWSTDHPTCKLISYVQSLVTSHLLHSLYGVRRNGSWVTWAWRTSSCSKLSAFSGKLLSLATKRQRCLSACQTWTLYAWARLSHKALLLVF